MNKTLVIIPHYNKLSLLKECVKYLDCQNYDNFDVIIIDNGSTDGSTEFIYELSDKNERYHNILFNENMGFAYAVNKGLKYSIDNEYDYSLLLNNDAYIKSDFVENIVDTIENKKHAFAVSSLMLSYKNPDTIDSFGDYYTILGWPYQGHVGLNINEIEYDEEVFSACGGASIYKNSVLKKIGFFDEKFFAYLEDIDISYRAKLHGFSIYTCKDAVCYHLGSATSGSKYNSFKVKTSARNNVYLIYKNMPFIQLAINLIPIALGSVVKFLFFLVRGYGFDYLLGTIDGIRNIGMIDRVDFRKISIFTFIGIEVELIINTFKYMYNFIKRHSK